MRLGDNDDTADALGREAMKGLGDDCSAGGDSRPYHCLFYPGGVVESGGVATVVLDEQMFSERIQCMFLRNMLKAGPLRGVGLRCVPIRCKDAFLGQVFPKRKWVYMLSQELILGPCRKALVSARAGVAKAAAG